MSVHNSAKFQHCGVIFAKSTVDTKNRLFFFYRALFFADTVQNLLQSFRKIIIQYIGHPKIKFYTFFIYTNQKSRLSYRLTRSKMSKQG
jgi:hypothetical protein